jgi:hypothetical protein
MSRIGRNYRYLHCRGELINGFGDLDFGDLDQGL